MPRVEKPHDSTLFSQNLEDKATEETKAQADGMKAWPLPKKIQYLKVWLQEQNLKKTGINTYNKFEYFQLPDFLPLVNRKMFELDMFAHFEITPPVVNAENGVFVKPEMAMLTISHADSSDSITYSCPTAVNNAGGNPIQAAGGVHTYLRRYLWIDALDVAEGDEIDQTAGMPEKPKKGASPAKNETQSIPAEKPATDVQISVIKTLLSEEDIDKVCKAKGWKSLADMTLIQANEMIKWAKGKKGVQ